QLLGAFHSSESPSDLSIAGKLDPLDEYWVSELCSKMVKAVRDPERVLREDGLRTGSLAADPNPSWEEDAGRVMSLLGKSVDGP
ncbi:unnamed protein product, partial [Choristocarpus tenellus]